MQNNWADKVAIAIMVIASVVLLSAMRFAIRLGGWA